MIKIGLISDTHIPEAGTELPARIAEIFRGVDLILHAGDLHVLRVLDWLEGIAPVLAARGNGDLGLHNRPMVPYDPRLKKSHRLSLEGITIGLIHALPLPDDEPWTSLEAVMQRNFRGAVDVIVCGCTHVEMVKGYDGVLVVNPGSPTLPHQIPGRPGTLGILGVCLGEARAEIIHLD